MSIISKETDQVVEPMREPEFERKCEELHMKEKMSSNKFEYFLNAIHYCLWLGEVKSSKFVERVVNTLLSPIPKYLFTKEYKKKYYERLPRERKKLDKFFYDKETGTHICWAHHWFGYFYSCYPAFLSFILLGVVFRYFGNTNRFIAIFATAIPIIIFYIPAYRAVFSKDRYLQYFKQFEKKDKQWHKKWKRITRMFCIGAVVTMLLGIGAIWGVLLL